MCPTCAGCGARIGSNATATAVTDHPLNRHVERIEQCGDRVVVTAGRVIHDMRADGVLEHGVDDVAEADSKTRIRVAAVFNGGGSTCIRGASTRRGRRW